MISHLVFVAYGMAIWCEGGRAWSWRAFVQDESVYRVIGHLQE